MKKRNLVILIIATLFFACGNNHSETKKTEGNHSEEKSEEKVSDVQHQDYRGVEIAFVKDEKLYFYYLDTKEIKPLEEEKEPVFNCVFDNTTELIYYTVERDSMLWLKKAYYDSDKPCQITEICNLKVSPKSCVTETEFEKSQLRFNRAEEVILPYDFVWDYFAFQKKAAYPTLVGNNVAEHGELSFEEMQAFSNFEQDVPHQVKDNQLIYEGHNLSKDIYIQMPVEDEELEEQISVEFTDFKFSNDRSKVYFSVFLELGDVSHGPSCLADVNGNHQQTLLDDGISAYYEPVWLGNQLVFWRQTEGEQEFDFFKQLCITNAEDNSVSVLVERLDYFTVRELPQSKRLK